MSSKKSSYLPDVQGYPFAYQGKQITQIIAFIWRWADKNSAQSSQDKDKKKHPTDQEKRTAALDLLNGYFFRESPDQLVNLFGADPRRWIENGSDPTYQWKKEAELLITVFGKSRILNKSQYLSPIFNDQELGRGEEYKGLTHYRFYLDPSTFLGYLTDPKDLSYHGERKLYYHIAFPPRPQFGPTTLKSEDLDDWINSDTKQILPKNPFIPASCC